MAAVKTLISFIVFAIMFISCRNEGKPKSEPKNERQTAIQGQPVLLKRRETKKPIVYKERYMSIKDVLINGHHMILSRPKFNSLYKKIDSSKTELWECGDPFEWLDEKWMKATYGDKSEKSGTFEKYEGNVTTLFAQNIEFNTNNHIVLINTAFAKSNSFEIPKHQIVLNQNTSIEDFRKTFPLAKMEKLEDPDEVRFRFYLEAPADDAFLFYFKNGKLNYLKLWWLLC
ncbi:hypothetical protein [Pedobacter sp. D749]|uniref:hypothetical protein n=1 Tax=Pedobacter sp. D749 TaxID=2856523 RepID=UPI001C5A1188|nr:hypothetical protein [Pedobacter sp. D749]QXU43643.1 hypothetical protein KYH19_08695 [Pedobacter sp. D749]